MPKIADKALQYTWDETIPEGVRDPGYCRIMVMGVGGAGNNTINRLMEAGNVAAECVALNTDMQHLKVTHAKIKLLIGEKLTRGLGSGGDPEVGKAAIEESTEQVSKILEGVDISFCYSRHGRRNRHRRSSCRGETSSRKRSHRCRRGNDAFQD